jgi:hypothetical protein
MTATPNDPTELAQLRQELDTLRKEFQELRGFLRVSPAGEEGPAHLDITCTSISLCDPKGQPRGRLMAAEDAAFLALDGTDEKQRIFLGVENNEPVLEFQTAAHEPTLHLWAGAESGRGEIAVFEKGKPRAVIKAFDNECGSVAVTHENGTPCVGMVSQKTGGQLVLFTPEQKIAVRLFSDTEAAPEGGMITVNRKDGQPSATLLAGKNGGSVMLLDKNDFHAAMTATEHGGNVIVKAADKKSSISLMSAANGHSSVSVSNSENRSLAELCAEDHGGALIIRDAQDHERAVIRLAEEGPFMEFKGAEGKDKCAVLMTGFGDKGALYLRNPRGHVAGLNMNDFGGSLNFADEQNAIQLHLGFDEKQSGLHLKPQSGGNSVAALITQEQGGLLMVSAPDGIRRGYLCALNDGGQLCLFNDFGIERVLLGSAKDGGALKLQWGGTPAVIAVATDQGGGVVVNDAEGRKAASLPPPEDEPEF